MANVINESMVLLFFAAISFKTLQRRVTKWHDCASWYILKRSIDNNSEASDSNSCKDFPHSSVKQRFTVLSDF